LFGTVTDGKVRLNDAGRIIQNMWSELPGRFSQIDVGSFVVMPNHIHGVIVVGAQFIAPSNSPPGMVEDAARGAMNRAPTVGEVIRVYKAVSARAIRSTINADFRWQRNYYEHIVRNEESLNRIRQYIVDNPIRWDSDRDNPAVITPEPKDAWQLR
jgi:REP element-mobilizing transposase RayT